MKNLLVTFGCSWAFGKGVGYEEGMEEKEYYDIKNKPELCNNLSYRGLISKKYNFYNLNFAKEGSSNQKQIRLAKYFFSGKEIIRDDFESPNFLLPLNKIQKKIDKVIVLWAITSTARYELFSKKLNNLQNAKYSSSNDELTAALLRYSYNHDNEVKNLSYEIQFWNDYFKNKNISVLWLDTFNHHDYIINLDNFINFNKKPRDLLSSITNIESKHYHLSSGKNDDTRISTGIANKLLNPISFHPTKLGHQKIFDIICPHIENLL